MWFYQDVEETDHQAVTEPKPGASRQLRASTSRPAAATQPVMKKKLFLTDGWDVPLTGLCIYIFRTNTVKQLPEEGFQKVYVEDGGNLDMYKKILGFILRSY